MSLLDVSGLSLSLQSPSRAPINIVNDLSFQVGQSEIFGLAGESGCGKSLTALAIMGILPQNILPTAGSISHKGRELLGMDEDKFRALRGAEIAMVFQEPMTSLNPVLTIGYQIEEVVFTHLGVTKAEARHLALSLLRSVKIPSPEVRMDEYPHQLSGGMRQRVMIAMAIACGPSLLIADEPTTALDVTIEAQILDLLQELRKTKNMSVLLITHDLGVIAENADRVAIMYAGRLVELSSVKSLFANPAHPYTSGLLGSMPETKGTPLTPIPGTVPKPSELPQGCKFNNRCSYAIKACSEAEPALINIAAPEDTPHLTRCIRSKDAPWRRP